MAFRGSIVVASAQLGVMHVWVCAHIGGVDDDVNDDVCYKNRWQGNIKIFVVPALPIPGTLQAAIKFNTEFEKCLYVKRYVANIR